MPGFSIDVDGKWTIKNGLPYAAVMKKANSVDLVTNPAAGGEFERMAASENKKYKKGEIMKENARQLEKVRQVGNGWIWLGINLVLLTDRDGDDRMDGREVILSGFDDHDTHHAIGAYCDEICQTLVALLGGDGC